MNKYLPFGAACLLLAAACPSAASGCAADGLEIESAAKVRAYLEDVYPDTDSPGAAVLVACNGQAVFTYNAGMADMEWQQPISSNTAFRLGSISKPLTAVAILQLVEQGRVDLDLPVSTYVPLLPDYMRPVTVRQLLNHSSGLPDILLTPALMPLARDWVSGRQIIDMQAHTPPRAAPGERYEYSNFNYVLLATLIEYVTDTRYGDYMDRHLHDLGMTHSGFDTRRAILPERAHGFELDQFGNLLHSENIDSSHASAAGGLLSSANDLSKWAYLLMSSRLITSATRDDAWSPQSVGNGDVSTYGLGFNVSVENGHRVIWHNGLASGFQAAFSMYPDDGLVVIVLSNGFHLPNTTRAMDSVAHIVLQGD